MAAVPDILPVGLSYSNRWNRFRGLSVERLTAIYLLRSRVLGGLTKTQRAALILTAIGFVFAGSLHFVRPEPYVRILPPYLPWHRQLVAISGLFEILGGLGLLFSPVRRAAAWGLVALLVSVFPANIYMAMDPLQAGAASVPPIVLWGRLPLQPVLIWLVLWCTKPHPQSRFEPNSY